NGATSHSNSDQLTHVKLHFLPPHTTPYLQPYAINAKKEIPQPNFLDAISCWRKTEIVLSSEWSQLSWNMLSNEETGVRTRLNSVNIDDTLEIEEVVLDEMAIIEEILPQPDSNSNDDEQQEPIKFVKDQDLSQLQ
ncbi:12742_t:CDS:2, partial [Cetraspora pellucida]